jgi:hypothetical protein
MAHKTLSLKVPYRLIDIAVLALVAYFALSLGASIARRDIETRQTSQIVNSSFSVI